MKNDTTCSLVQDVLPSYIDGLTNEKTNQFVCEHVRTCEKCRRVYDAMNTKATPAELHAQELVRTMIREKRQMRLLAGLAGILVLLIAAVCILPLPRKINIVHEALEWRCGDSEYSVSRKVEINGIYYDYLFRKDYFDGTFVVEGYPETDNIMMRCSFVSNGFGSLWYCDANGAPQNTWGSLAMNPNGKEFFVIVDEDNGWNGGTGLVLTAPAANREEAVNLTNRLSKKYSPNWLGVCTLE